jgi:hypothetical protein
MRLVSISIALVLLLSTVAAEARDPVSLSMVALLGNPQKYHGKFIRVIGFLSLDYECTALWLHKEDYAKGLHKNALWVDLPFARKRDPRQGHYVLIEGVFNASEMGHRWLYSGTIQNITRAELWK